MIVRIAKGAGYQSQTLSGRIYTGGYDPRTGIVYLGDSGHPQGVNAAGGVPTHGIVSGITMIETEAAVLWSDTSPSLPSVLSASEREAVTEALKQVFIGKAVRFSAHIQ